MTQLSPPQHRAYTYRVDEVTAIPDTFRTLVKQHGRITDTVNDLIDVYLAASFQAFEDYTGRDLLTKTYTTFRDFFPTYVGNEGYYQTGLPRQTLTTDNNSFLLKKSALQTVESVVYDDTSTGGEVTIDASIYYVSKQSDYSALISAEGQEWPFDVLLDQEQSIRIEFKCGFGDDMDAVPFDIQVALMNHTLMLYENRGDCIDCDKGSGLPVAVRNAYRSYRILNL